MSGKPKGRTGGKDKGGRREREARDLLIEDGYSVLKSGASLGAWDLIAIPAESGCVTNAQGEYLVLFVQVKSNRWPPPTERSCMERQHIYCPHSRQIWRCDDFKGWRILVLVEDGWHRLEGQTVAGLELERQP